MSLYTSTFLLQLLLAVGVVCRPASLWTGSHYEVKDTHTVPSGWSKSGSPLPDHLITLRIALTQGKFDELERHLYEISNPSHSRYGQHLSKIEIDDLVRPADQSTKAVEEWLSIHGISRDALLYNSASNEITIPLEVAKIEQMLNTEYFVYTNKNDGDELVRTHEWSLPKHLHEHIAMVQPTNSFFRPTGHTSMSRTQQGGSFEFMGAPPSAGTSSSLQQICNSTSVMPACIRTYYQTINYVPKKVECNSMALTNYLDQVSNRSDVRIFLKNFRPDAVNAADQFRQVKIAGGSLSQARVTPAQKDDGLNFEGNIDAEQMLSIAYPTKLTTYNTGGRNPTFKPSVGTTKNTDEPFLVWQNYVLGLRQLPYVISTSYGDSEITMSKAYAEHVCRNFAQIGARGTTMFVSSGDSGVGGDGTCFSNDGKKKAMFLPSFPASCPFVTVVGASQGFAPEVAALRTFSDGSRYTSGGGFSNYFTRPSYQDAIIKTYLNTLPKGQYAGLYNPNGRGYPDMSAQGYVILFYYIIEIKLLLQTHNI